MEFRSGKQCRERYINHLDPDTKKTVWTDEEDQVIRDNFSKYGTKWSQYIPALPGRSDNSIKNRYHIISRSDFGNGSRRAALSSLKRKWSNHSFSDSEADTSQEDASYYANRMHLSKLLIAREKLDREIFDLEHSLEKLNAHAALSAAPSKIDLQAYHTCTYMKEQNDITGFGGNFDFEWSTSEPLLAAEPAYIF